MGTHLCFFWVWDLSEGLRGATRVSLSNPLQETLVHFDTWPWKSMLSLMTCSCRILPGQRSNAWLELQCALSARTILVLQEGHERSRQQADHREDTPMPPVYPARCGGLLGSGVIFVCSLL